MSQDPTPPDPDVQRRRRSRQSAARLVAQLLDEEDVRFLEALAEVDLLEELDPEEQVRIASEVDGKDAESRRVDMLELYFTAGGDAEAAARRVAADRFFLQRLGEPTTATRLVARLAALTPELGSVTFDRIGGEEGPLVLRAGEHAIAVLDDYEEGTDTGQYDLAEAEARRGRLVSVRSLIRALNGLLDRHGVRERFVGLRGDEVREVYVAVGVTEAVQLGQGGWLEDEAPEEVMELGAW